MTVAPKIQNRAEKSSTVALALSLLFPPFAYFYIGKKTLAVLNAITLNFLLIGYVIVPIHVYTSIKNARKKVNNVD